METIISFNFEQGTYEWHAIRKGRMTASHAQEIGNNGKGLDTYIFKVLANKFSSGEQKGYTNEKMENGVELEPLARDMYELECGVSVEQVGFITYGDYVGCSPDGLVGNDGGIEIKCHDDVGHFKLILNGEKEIDSKYWWQIQMNLLITGRSWWDYVAFNPNFQKSLLIFRVLPDKKAFEDLLVGFETGTKKIQEITQKVNQTM